MAFVDLTKEQLIKFIGNEYEYRLRLISDAELADYAVVILNKQDILNSSNFNFESSLFGNTRTETCGICGQSNECTCAHYGLIALRYSVLTNPACENLLIKVIRMICPHCGKLPIENPEFTLKYQRRDRCTKMYNEVSKRFDKLNNSCPHCKQAMTHITANGTFPLLDFYHNPNGKGSLENCQMYNPNYIHSLLMNITDETREYLGLSQTCDPRNFMTKYIVIVPNKLRMRTIDKANSELTAIYNKLSHDINRELNNYYSTFVSDEKFIPINNHTEKFLQKYRECCGMYASICDTTTPSRVNIINKTLSKRNNNHNNPSSSMIGHLKGKDQSYLEKGIIGTRHNTSARTVIGGATDLHSMEIGFPQKYCVKMGVWIPVYKENLKIMQQFVAQMANIQKHDKEHIKAIRYMNGSTGKTPNIKPNNAVTIAAQILPGDKIYMSLIPGSLIMHCRFPAVREESWATHELVPTEHTIQTLPLAACGYKNADFDGDETGIYANHGWYTDAESLLLHSLYRQILDYKNGSIGIFYSTDSPYELKKMTKDTLIGIVPVKDPISDRTIGRKSIYPPVKAIEVANHFLDIITGHVTESVHTFKKFSKIPKINYEDKSTKIVDNKFDPEKFGIVNQSFYIYLTTIISAERVINLIDLFIQLGYCSANYDPFTLGREIRLYGNTRQKIEEIHENTFNKLKVLEETDIDSITKERKQYIIVSEEKVKIMPLIAESVKNSNLEKQGLMPKFGNEMFKSVVAMSPIYINGHRIQNTLGGNNRTCIAFSNHSTDPCAYGYIRHGYLDYKIQPTDTFFDCMLQRRSMYDRGVGVAIGGYLSKEFIMAFGPMVTDSNGAVMFYDKFVSPVYGLGGYNPRFNFYLPLFDIEMSSDDIDKKYGSKVSVLHRKIRQAQDSYKYVTNFISQNIVNGKFNAGFDFEQFLNNQQKGKTDEKIVDELIDQMKEIFAPTKMVQRYSLLNFIYIEYYFRTKLQQIKIDRDTAVAIYYKYVDSLVETGETVGMKASLALGEGLTQDLLDAIHHATGGGVNTNKIKNTGGNSRFKELLSQASIAPDTIVLTLGFYDSSKENVEKFALEQETLYFSDIWVNADVYVSDSISQEVKTLHPTIDFSQIGVSKYHLEMIWNLTKLGDYEIPVSKVYAMLCNNFDKITFVTGKVENAKHYKAYIYFNEETKKEDIDMYIALWHNKNKSTTINGNMLVNCFVTQNINTGEYILQANIYKPSIEIRKEDKAAISYNTVAFKEIILDPRIDPMKCRTNETKRATGKITANVYDTDGIFEATCSLHEETSFCSNILSNVGNIAARHYKTITTGCLVGGDYFFASANSAAKSDGDYFRKLQFEQPSKFIHQAVLDGRWKTLNDIIASQYFGTIPKVGSGYSQTMVFKN